MGRRIVFLGGVPLALALTAGCIPDIGAMNASCGSFWPWTALTCGGGGGATGGADAGPYVALTAANTAVASGAEVTVTADVTGAGEGEPTYEWSPTCGTLDGTEASVVWTAPTVDGTGTETCTVTCVVTVPGGAQTWDSLVFSVSAAAPGA